MFQLTVTLLRYHRCPRYREQLLAAWRQRRLEANHYPSYGHASVMDTSEMLYLSTRDGHDYGWVKLDLIKTAVGDPVLARGQRRDPNAPRINNGITGDARPSTPELGKRIFDMKVDYAVRQMKEFLASAK